MSSQLGGYVGDLYRDFRHAAPNKALARRGVIERFYLRYITQLAMSRFKWSGFPEEPEGDIRPRYLELTLFRHALAVFFRHKKWDKYLCMRASTPGNMDMYYDPTAFNLYGNGSTPGIDGLTVSAKDAVPIWGNMLRTPELDLVSIYVQRMAEFDLTVDINVMAMRHPFMVYVNDRTKHSVLNAWRQVEEGQPVIVFNDAMNVGSNGVKDLINVFDMKLDPDLVTQLLIDKRKVWNELLTFLGINNSNQDKRERLVQSEVTANDSEVLMARATSMDERERACEAINKKFGLDVEVEWNTRIQDMADMPAMMAGYRLSEGVEGDVDGTMAREAEKGA